MHQGWARAIAPFVFALCVLGCSHPARRQGGQPSTAGTAAQAGLPAGASGAGVGAGVGAGAPGGGANAVGGTGGGAAPGEQVVEGTDGGVEQPPVMKMSCPDSTYSDAWLRPYTPDPAVQSQVQASISGMTLSEKADQMRGTPKGGGQYTDIFRTLDNDMRGIRGFRFRDGPRGVNLAAELPDGKNGYSTSFPAPIARGAAFDMDLEYKIGQAIGDETLASGNTLILAPTVNILRHPAWGRAQETYGEDPYLLGRLGTAFVVGTQEYIPACVKHYAANNIENGRGSANAQMDEQTLREIYGRAYEMIVRDGGVACVMAAYNQVNGKHSTQSKHLLSDILRDDFGFAGFVLSDWWAMPGGRDPTAATQASNAAEAILAGLDMELPWALHYTQIESITGNGRPLAESDITRAATRVLEQKYRFKVASKSGSPGLKQPTTMLSGQGSIEGNDAHVELAHRAAVESITLLKNEGPVLPIDRTTVRNIAVIGAVVPYSVADTNDQNGGVIDFANTPRTGDLGSSRVFADPGKSTGPAAGIRAVAGAGITVNAGADPNLADQADFVVVVAGLTPEDEGEEYTRAGDRPGFGLDAKKGGTTQNNLIMQVAQKGKPMVVVLEGGSVIDMSWLSQVPAVVMAWYPGMDGGRAIAELLFGDANFSGKLPITWPKRWEDEPTFNSGTTTQMDYYLGYRHFDQAGIEPLYPFGYGLSYASYAYSNLQVPCSDVGVGGVVEVSVDVENQGSVAGEEAVLLFVSYPDSTARRPVKELKGFYRVALDPGQKKRVTIPLRVSDLKFWDMGANMWRVETGTVKVMLGPNAADLALSDTFSVR